MCKDQVSSCWCSFATEYSLEKVGYNRWWCWYSDSIISDCHVVWNNSNELSPTQAARRLELFTHRHPPIGPRKLLWRWKVLLGNQVLVPNYLTLLQILSRRLHREWFRYRVMMMQTPKSTYRINELRLWAYSHRGKRKIFLCGTVGFKLGMY